MQSSAEEDDSTCAAQLFEELDKAGAKLLLCGANSATCSAGCEALVATRTAWGIFAASKLQLTLSMTQHGLTAAPLCIATQHLTLPHIDID